ncbi:RICIN domain-containing protein [Clostridium sp. SM-530-WT-3G]|nr:RICIN domain-containing protein [Clostridium sp. SM-530-WT-3G]NME83587.1 RICIN domain-containing protein [Clostridium sp. SM-530-WT-3G]
MGSSSQPQNPAPKYPIQNDSNVSVKDGWYYIKNVNAQKYLQVTNNTGIAGQNIEIGTGTGVQGQKWYVKNLGNGYITLQSGLGNFMIDIANGQNSDGTNVCQWSYGGYANQQWIFEPVGI